MPVTLGPRAQEGRRRDEVLARLRLIERREEIPRLVFVAWIAAKRRERRFWKKHLDKTMVELTKLLATTLDALADELY